MYFDSAAQLKMEFSPIFPLKMCKIFLTPNSGELYSHFQPGIIILLITLIITFSISRLKHFYEQWLGVFTVQLVSNYKSAKLTFVWMERPLVVENIYYVFRI